MAGEGLRARTRKDLHRQRRRRPHSCWDHLLMEGATRLADLPPAAGRTVVVLGHEQAGIPPGVHDLLDEAVEIPMVGTGASLNVAVAGSLVLYRVAGLG